MLTMMTFQMEPGRLSEFSCNVAGKKSECEAGGVCVCMDS